MPGLRSGLLKAVLLLLVVGASPNLHAALYSLTASEKLFVSLSNDLIVNGNTTIRGDVGLGGAGASLQIQNISSISAAAPYTGAADFSGTVSCSGTGCPEALREA